MLCRNVTVRDVKVSSYGPNNDGSNPESCCDVLIEGCLFDTGDDCIALKSGRNREGIHCRNIHVGQVSGAAVEVDFHYEEGAGGPHLPRVSGIDVRGVTCWKSGRVLALRGYPEAPIRDVTIEDCTFENAAGPDVIEHVEGLRMVRVKRS